MSWKNDDAVNHTATAENDAFASGYIPPGGSYSFTFTQQGRYEFRCTIHRQMRGEVDVYGLVLSGPRRPSPPAAVSSSPDLRRPGPPSVTLRGGGRAGRRRATTGASPCGSRSGRRRPTGRSQRGSRAPGSSSRSSRRACDPQRADATRGDDTRAAGRTGRRAELRPGAVRLAQRHGRRADRRSRAAFRIPAHLERVRAVVRGTKGWADAASPGLSLTGGGVRRRRRRRPRARPPGG